MTMSRNFKWKIFLEEEKYFFSREAIFASLAKEFHSIELNTALNKILRNMYIDQKPRRAIKTPMLCKFDTRD